MQVNAYLNFDGSCEAAFRFYAESLGGKIDAMVPHVGTPSGEHVPADWGAKILHASMSLGGTVLMGSDSPPGRYQQPQGFSVSLQAETPEEAERAFQALSRGGTVQMPLQETFFSARFGILVDQFHVPWMINCTPGA
jgi:PhnB protein